MAYLSTTQWDELVARALAGEGADVAFQPVIELTTGEIVGYEALARFAGPPGLRPDHWFRAARARGVVARLDAVVLERALARRVELPARRFLSVNLEPDSVGHPSVDAALRASGLGEGLVLELTEHVAVEADGFLEDRLQEYRDAGVRIAVDDAGSGYAGLQRILRLRPALLKLDRALVEGVERDGAKVALIDMLTVFAHRVGAAVLAEGVESDAEAATLLRLGVPLAQGFFFAEPGAPWPQLQPEAQRFFREPSARPMPGPAEAAGSPRQLAALLAPATAVPAEEAGALADQLAASAAPECAVVLDGAGRALALVDRRGVHAAPLSIGIGTSLVDAAEAMLARPPAERFCSVVCSRPTGEFVGVLAPERLIAALAGIADARALSPRLGSVAHAATG